MSGRLERRFERREENTQGIDRIRGPHVYNTPLSHQGCWRLGRIVLSRLLMRDEILGLERVERMASGMYPRYLPVYGFPIIAQIWAVWGTHAWEGS